MSEQKTTFKASCKHCKTSVTLPERPKAGKSWLFKTPVYPVPGFIGGGVHRCIDGSYQGCCQKCSDAMDRGEMELALTSGGRIVAVAQAEGADQ
jgi:hypothetical protein